MEINVDQLKSTLIEKVQAISGFSKEQSEAMVSFLAGGFLDYNSVNIKDVEYDIKNFKPYKSIEEAHKDQIDLEIEDVDVRGFQKMSKEKLKNKKIDMMRKDLEKEGELLEASDGSVLFFNC